MFGTGVDMRKIITVILILFAVNIFFAEKKKDAAKNAEPPKKESTYRKASKVIDSIVKKTKPAAEKVLEKAVEDTKQSMQDFADDINAPKEEQSSVAKAFNFIADAHPEDNMGAHEKGEPVPDGIFVNGKMGSHEDLLK